MKVLYVVHQFFPDHKTGTEVLTLNTAKGMLQRGHRVAVFTGFPDDNLLPSSTKLDQYMYEGVNIWRYRHSYAATEEQPNIVESEYNNREAARYFKEILATYQPDVVHVFHFQRISASIIQVCKDQAIPMVYTPTDFWFVCPSTQLLLSNNEICPGPDRSCANCLKHLTMLRARGWKKSLFNCIPESLFSLSMMMGRNVNIKSNTPLAMAKALSLRGAFLKNALLTVDRILVPSHIMRRKLMSFLGGDKNFVDIPFGIDLPEKIKHKVSDCLRIGFIGTISHIKGPHILTEAMSSLQDGLNLEVHIYGDMETFPHYSQLIKKHVELDDRIKLRGIFPFEKINEIFSELDVLVVPSLWHENTPLVAYAAQAYGCPIIASRIDGLSDLIIDGKNGIFYSPGSVKELADILQGLCDSREGLGLMAKQAIAPNSVDDYMATLLGVYNSVLKEGKI